MAVPKKKTSVSKKGKRRAGQHHKLYSKAVILDPTTGELTKPHCISPSGFYKGKKIFETRMDREETEETTEE
jgi:large subunit ribosomal protein L32